MTGAHPRTDTPAGLDNTLRGLVRAPLPATLPARPPACLNKPRLIW